MNLDKSVKSSQDRIELAKEYLKNNPTISQNEISEISNYIIDAAVAEDTSRGNKHFINTPNRLKTITKHETSYEGLVSQLEGGEDSLHNLISDNNKNELLTPKIQINKREIAESAELQNLRQTIEEWKRRIEEAKQLGLEHTPNAVKLKKMLIDMNRDQYVIKMSINPPIMPKKVTRSKTITSLDDEQIEMDKDGDITVRGFSFLNPIICSLVLQNYSRLKEDNYGKFGNDMWAAMQDFDNLLDSALADEDKLRDIVICKIDGDSNADIRNLLKQKYDVTYSAEYISSLWRHRIPNLLSKHAQDLWVDWHFLMEEKGVYKRCSKCGQNKLALPRYFTRNKTSKDGFYSICKECRNKKR